MGDPCKTTKTSANTLLCPLLLMHPLDGKPAHYAASFEMQKLIHSITTDTSLQKPPLKTALASLQMLRLFKSNYFPPVVPVDLRRGCTGWSGPPYSRIPLSISELTVLYLGLAALLVCNPWRIFMQRLHSCGARKAITTALVPAHSPCCQGSSRLCMEDRQWALLTARKGGTARGIHPVTTLGSKYSGS